MLKAHGECPPEDCGGVWGYAELLELDKKKRKSAEDKERLEWYDIPKDYDPEACAPMIAILFLTAMCYSVSR